MAVQWQDDDPDETLPGWNEAMDEAARMASLRCLVYWVIPSSVLGAALLAWLAWQIYQWMIGG